MRWISGTGSRDHPTVIRQFRSAVKDDWTEGAAAHECLRTDPRTGSHRGGVRGRSPSVPASLTGPEALQPGQARRVRVRHRADAAAGRRRPVPGEVLPDRDALHRLRHRDRLPLPVGRRVRPARGLRARRDGAVHRAPCSSPTPTCGVAAAWSGTERRHRATLRGKALTMGLEEKLPSGFLLTDGREARRLRAQELAVAGHVRPGLLRDRDDGDRRRPLRPRPLRHGGLPRLAAAGRPDDRGRPGQPEDGAGAAPDLRPDARAQVGARDGRLRVVGRHVQQLRDRAGRRPRRPGRHVPAGLPAAPGDADGRDPQAARARSRTPSSASNRSARGARSCRGTPRSRPRRRTR